MKTPTKYYGGKQRMTKNILPLIPPHHLYCEPFVGGGAIFWAKPPSSVEVINDLSGDVTNFYQVCKRDFGMLRILVMSTPHSRKMHRQALMVIEHPDLHSSIKRAWAFWVLTNMGFAAVIGKGWGYEKKSNAFSMQIKNKRDRFGKWYQQRLDLVQIECNDALQVIKSRDTSDSFFYCDPPYYNSNCGHYEGYTEADYTALLELLSRIKGKFLLSSYLSPVLEDYTKVLGWHTKTFRSAVAVNHKANKIKTEVLTANYSI